MTKKTIRFWSPYRPEKPRTDPIYEQIVELLVHDNRSRWDQANDSGLSTTTLSNWTKHKVRHPQASSLQMAARLLGKKIVLVDD